jgi:hypothetical protein
LCWRHGSWSWGSPLKSGLVLFAESKVPAALLLVLPLLPRAALEGAASARGLRERPWGAAAGLVAAAARGGDCSLVCCGAVVLVFDFSVEAEEVARPRVSVEALRSPGSWLRAASALAGAAWF